MLMFRMPMSSVERRITTTLFIVSSLASAAMIASFTLTPIIAAALSGSAALTGLPNTLSMLGRAGAGYPLGWLLDRAGRRIGLAVGLLCLTCGMLISAAAINAGSFLGFLSGAVLLGVGRSALEQTRFAAAEIFRPALQARVIGGIVFAGTIGAVGGPLLVKPAANFALRLGLDQNVGPFWWGAALMALAVALLLTSLRPDPKRLAERMEQETRAADAARGHQAGASADTETRERESEIWRLFKMADVRLAIAAMVIGQLVMTLLMVITPLHMSRADYSTEAISWVIMGHTLGMFGLSGVTGWLTARFGRVPMIVAGALVQILSAILAPFSVALPGLLFSLFLLGLGWNFSFIAGSSLLSAALESSRQRGRVQGINEALVALASAAGSLGTGSVYALSGIAAVSVIGVAFSTALGALTLWLGRARLFALSAERS